MTRTALNSRFAAVLTVVLMVVPMLLVASPASAQSFGASGSTVAGWFNQDRRAYGQSVDLRVGDVPDSERAAHNFFTLTGNYGESFSTVATRRQSEFSSITRAPLFADNQSDPDIAAYISVSTSCDDSAQTWRVSVTVESRYDLPRGGSSGAWKGPDMQPCGGAPAPEPEPTEEPEPQPTEEPTEEPEPQPTQEPAPEPTRQPDPDPKPSQPPAPQPDPEPSRQPQPTQPPSQDEADEPRETDDPQPEAVPTESERPSSGGAQVPSNVQTDVPMDSESVEQDGAPTVDETQRPSRPSSADTGAEVEQVDADTNDEVTVLAADEAAAPADSATQGLPSWMVLVGATVLAMLALVTMLLVRRERAD